MERHRIARRTHVVRSRRPEWSEWSLVIAGVVGSVERCCPRRALVAIGATGDGGSTSRRRETPGVPARGVPRRRCLVRGPGAGRRARPHRRPRSDAPSSPPRSLGRRTLGQRGRHASHVAGRNAAGLCRYRRSHRDDGEEFVTDAPLEVTCPASPGVASATVVLVLAIADWLVARRSPHAD